LIRRDSKLGVVIAESYRTVITCGCTFDSTTRMNPGACTNAFKISSEQPWHTNSRILRLADRRAGPGGETWRFSIGPVKTKRAARRGLGNMIWIALKARSRFYAGSNRMC